MRPGSDVHASLGNPRRLKATGGSDIEAREKAGDGRLESRPARGGGIRWREKGTSLTEMMRVKEA